MTTVRDVIEKLQHFDPDLPVELEYDGEYNAVNRISCLEMRKSTFVGRHIDSSGKEVCYEPNRYMAVVIES